MNEFPVATPEYLAMVADKSKDKRDAHGFMRSDLDPFDVLRAAQAPASVVSAFELARSAGWDVYFGWYSSHVAWSEYVVAVGSRNAAVENAFNEIDRSGIPDNRGVFARAQRWSHVRGDAIAIATRACDRRQPACTLGMDDGRWLTQMKRLQRSYKSSLRPSGTPGQAKV